MTLSLRRGDSPAQFFDSWRDYLHARTGSETTLCRALAVTNEPLVREGWAAVTKEIQEHEVSLLSSPDDSDLRAARDEAVLLRDFTHQRVGIPWVTPVLGTGCLSASDGNEAVAIASLPSTVAEAASSWGRLPDGTAKRDAVQEFAHALLCAKLGGEETTGEARGGASDPTDRTLAAYALLCAYLLARLYFEVGALLSGPKQASSVPLEFDKRIDGPTPLGAETFDKLARPLLQALEDMKTAAVQLSKSPVNGADNESRASIVEKFANVIAHDLTDRRPKVLGTDVDLMAEIAWLFMTEGTSQYPGWSDLLVLLGFAFDSTNRRHLWPHLTNLNTARSVLESELARTTAISWQTRFPDSQGEISSTRDRLYDTVADLLIAQAHMQPPRRDRHSDANGTDACPAAVAFITSFDLELEMALLAKRQRFALVMPFYVQVVGSEPAGGYVWLRTTIEAPDTHRALTEEDICRVRTPQQWELVGGNIAAQDEREDIPIVVRLTGSPLVAGPDLSDRVQEGWAVKLSERLGGSSRLMGTVVVDEHTALQQWAADLGMLKTATSVKDRLGLPASYLSGMDEDTDARFWLLLGTQLNDDAVRQRIAATIAASNLRGMIGGAVGRTKLPQRTGVVVNMRTTPRQRDVFLWQGLDVVRGTYADVVPALEHAADHARKPQARRRAGDESCELGGAQ